jgi:phage-related protein
LLTDTPRAEWTLVAYRRNGDENDVPFATEFAEPLAGQKFVVLDRTLKHELAVLGTSCINSKAHPMECKSKQKPQPAVLMLKIEEGAGSVRVVLRVFFETAPNHTIVLLHGYDKGASDSPSRERREADVACSRRADLRAQLADPSRRDAAVASLWP